ncbi:MAG: DNA polymerase III subunit gamma/tau [Candidatus Omnitrophica bacterium]|nr:DNA polymerase III subunit gamma/tau [Candidatus Omnitrophota bacterium]
MSYQVLAQKYRPQTFEDVIGQETVTRTLKNSVLQDRSANAHIFSGPRGVGKTSVARLLSKALNCEKSPKDSPCNQCTSCKEITRGNNIDVLEIDGASNNGVDEIRTLRENVKFSPSKSRFKIYIIDEVHMLSQGAFNALLKTLEEPPAHVRFIFATTEPHKVISTIMSRCQRFEFRRIPPRMIFDRVMDIAKTEKIALDEKAALLIARAADGSMRDGLVILDQAISFSGEKITAGDVIELLGIVHKDEMFDLAEAVITGDAATVARTLDEMISLGKDPVFIANSLIAHYRDIMVIKTTGAPTRDMMFSEDELGRISSQIEKLSMEEVLYILQNLSQCITLMKGAMFARAPLEIALIRLTRRGNMLSLPAVLEKLDNISKDGFPAGDKPTRQSSPASIDNGGTKKETSDLPEVQSSASVHAETSAEEVSSDGNDENTSEILTVEQAGAHWKAILNYVKSKKMSLFTFLNVAKPVEADNRKFIVGFGQDHVFNKEAVEAGDNRKLIEEAVEKVTGHPLRVEFSVLDFLGDGKEEKESAAQRKTKSKEEMKPIVERAMDVFGGHVVRDFMEDVT